jgi:hypothetical protein
MSAREKGEPVTKTVLVGRTIHASNLQENMNMFGENLKVGRTRTNPHTRAYISSFSGYLIIQN